MLLDCLYFLYDNYFSYGNYHFPIGLTPWHWYNYSAFFTTTEIFLCKGGAISYLQKKINFNQNKYFPYKIQFTITCIYL